MPHVLVLPKPQHALPSYPPARGATQQQSLEFLFAPIRLPRWSVPQYVEVQEGLAEDGILLAPHLFNTLGLTAGTRQPISFGVLTTVITQADGFSVPGSPSVHICEAVPFRMNDHYPASPSLSSDLRFSEEIPDDLVILSSSVFERYFPRAERVDAKWKNHSGATVNGFCYTAAATDRCKPLSSAEYLHG